MKKGICPKCGSSEVYSGANVFAKQGAYGANAVPVTAWTFAPKDNYVCADCGYVESYISDANKLEKVKAKWNRVRDLE